MKLNPNLISSTSSPRNTSGQHEEGMEGGDNTVELITPAVDPDKTNLKVAHFLDFVRETVRKNQDKTYASWYDVAGECTASRTFGQIWETAGTIAHYLRCEWNVKKGERVILCYDFGLHFFEVFFGCLRAGVVAVLVYPPGPPLSKSLLKLAKVIDDCEPALILMDSRINNARNLDKLNFLSKSRHLWPNQVGYQVTDKLSRQPSLSFDEKTGVDDLAFLQYTSGSTGDPKGVMVTFKALSSNVDLVHYGYYQCYEADGGIPDEIVGFSWLPQYHDLGLIFAGIAPFAAGWRMHMMSPITFIKNPLLWLELMSRHKVQWGVAPDFSYALVARKFQEAQELNQESPLASLDLSSIRYLTTAAEPARPQTQEMFSQVFTAYGLREHWYSSGYGLAENVVGVAYVHGLHVSSPRQEDQSKVYIACADHSQLYPSLLLKIVNPETCTEIQGDATGELWIAGPTVAAGYYGKPELSVQTFKAQLSGMPGIDFLRTGDLAFFQSGYMYICGRIKDLIIVNGANHYPQDLEFAAQDASSAVRPGCVAAFASSEIDNGSSVEVVFEIRSQHIAEAEQVCTKVRGAIAQVVGIPISRVVAIAERSIPKTTSGKIQRRATREALHDGKLRVIHSSKMEERMMEKPAEERLVVMVDNHNSLSMDHNSNDMHGMVESTGCQHDFDDILSSVLGCHAIDEKDKSWDEIGLSSMASVQLKDAIADKFSVSLAPDAFDLFPTPALLKNHVLEKQGGLFQTELPELQQIPSVELSWFVVGMIQVAGIASISLLFAASVVPAWYVGKLGTRFVTPLSVGERWTTWMWFPLAVPVWMLTFSATVILCKWLVVGRYCAGTITSPSTAYLQWWYVDRAVHLWELFVGKFLLDTPLLWLFYTLLGAKVHPSAQFKAFVREFDLVQIGKGTTLKQTILCRVFSPWEKDAAGPTMRFRPIHVGTDCEVKGFLCPGVRVGDGSVVESLSVVREGSHVPARVVATGNPAKSAGSVVHLVQEPFPWWARDALKMTWLVFELYIFFFQLMVGQLVLYGWLPSDWHFTSLCFWFLLLAQLAVSSTLMTILLKWILIGKRRPGVCRETLWGSFAEWAADYHYRIGTVLLYSVTMFSSLLWNPVLMLMGMDVDMSSHVSAVSILPSNVDLIRVKQSLVARAVLDVKDDGHFHRIEVNNGSTVSRNARIGPGVTVSRATIAPQTNVTKNFIREDGAKNVTAPSLLHIIYKEAFIVLFYILSLFGILLSCVPGYELWVLAKPSSCFTAIPVLAASALLTTFFAVVLLGVFQYAAHLASGSSATQLVYAPVVALVTVTVTLPHALENWTFVSLFWGTPMFNAMLKMQGATLEGRMLYLGSHLCNTTCFTFTFADRTIIDHSITNGHYYEYNKVVVGPCRLSGVLHPHSFAMANTVVEAKESGPSRVLVPTTTKHCTSGAERADETSSITQDPTGHDELPVSMSIGVNAVGGSRSVGLVSAHQLQWPSRGQCSPWTCSSNNNKHVITTTKLFL